MEYPILSREAYLELFGPLPEPPKPAKAKKKAHPWRAIPVSAPKSNSERIIAYHAQMGIRANR